MKKQKLLMLVFGILAISIFSFSNAFAMEVVNDVEVGVESQLRSDPGDNKPIRHDHNYNKVKLNVSINQPVRNGDFLEIKTHGFPRIPVGDIFSSNDSSMRIGTIARKIEKYGTRVDQNRYDAETSEFEALRPEDDEITVYKVVFNENAENLQNISFSFGGNNILAQHSISNRNYSIERTILVNGNKKYSDEISVLKLDKDSVKNSFRIRDLILDSSNSDPKKRVVSRLNFIAEEDLSGSVVEIILPEDSQFTFSSEQSIYNKNRKEGLLYTDSTHINNQGVLSMKPDDNVLSQIIDVSDRKIKIRIDEQTNSPIFAILEHITMNITPEGAKYYDQNGSFLPLNYTALVKKGNKTYVNGKSSVNPIVRGRISEFSSNIVPPKKVEITDNVKNEDENLKSKEDIKKESIKAPNTGVQKESFNVIYLILGGVAVLVSTLATIFKK